MPSAGYFHSYRDPYFKEAIEKFVSMPSAGYFHSYSQDRYMFGLCLKIGVNALGGLFPFLRRKNMSKVRAVNVCQCPRRAISILTKRLDPKKSYWWVVSMPSAGYFHSYKMSEVLFGIRRNVCQCPRRAISILTF